MNSNLKKVLCAILPVFIVGFSVLMVASIFAATKTSLLVEFSMGYEVPTSDILSIYQPLNQTDPAWTKTGYNASLSANATKFETNSMSALESAINNKDANGNANITYGVDNYSSAPIYRKIDLVNVNILTGEIVGRLSDVSYNFEWFGRNNLDVYTYYPSFYAKRWIENNNQYISISESNFDGAVLVNSWYTSTFEATIFSPVVDANNNVTGYEIAYITDSNSAKQIITRSYAYDTCPLTYGSVNYALTNYENYTNPNSLSATASTTQQQILNWSANLTNLWKNTANEAGKTYVDNCQGAGYQEYVYNLLYLVKYANNNSQSVVGQGNINTFGCYSSNQWYKAAKGGSVIGLYDSSKAVNSKMTYGYSNTNYMENGTTGKTGLYSHQFLTYTTASKRIICDGTIGSDGYTSVFCLGKANPWGNVWTWIYGSAVIYDGTNLHLMVNLTNDVTNFHTATSGDAYATKKAMLEAKGYVELSYTLPTSANYYRYNGVSGTGLESLVGVPTSESSTGSTTTGLCDYYWCSSSTSNIFGVLVGGTADNETIGGAFYFYVNCGLAGTFVYIGFRLSLTP